MRIQKFILPCVVLMFSLFSCESESSLTRSDESYFVKYYGFEGNQQGVDIHILDDGGFLVLGNSIKTGSNSQIWLTRADALGNEIWSFEYGSLADEEAKDMVVDAAGNCYVGALLDEAGGTTDFIIYKIDLNGAQLDSAIFGFSGTSEVLNTITLTSTQELIAVGSTENVDITKSGYDPVTDLLDIYSVKMSLDLTPVDPFLWKTIIGYRYADVGTKVIERLDSNFIFFGGSSRPNSDIDKEGFNMMLYPTNNLGDPGGAPFETKFFGTLNNEFPVEIINTLDGGYAMIGTSVGAASRNIHSARVRNNIDLLVTEFDLATLPDLTGASITQSNSGGFLLLGTSNASTNGDITLFKVDDGGNLFWFENYGGLDNDYAAKVKENNDGTIMILGTVELESQQKIALIKTNPNGALKP